MYLTEIDRRVKESNSNIEMYIGRITDLSSIAENPFLRLELPFPTEFFNDFRSWSERIDPMVYGGDVEAVIIEWVSFNNQLRLLVCD
jgi:hypothetical protein